MVRGCPFDGGGVASNTAFNVGSTYMVNKDLAYLQIYLPTTTSIDSILLSINALPSSLHPKIGIP